jgi:capsular polysaccharide transport system permease protein
MYHLITHMRVVLAFVTREVATRYGRSPGGYIWAFLEPIGYVGLMSVLFSALARHPLIGETFPFFFATGYIAYSMYAGMTAYLSSSITANKSLLQYPNVAPIDPVLGRAILQAATSLVVGGIILWGTRHMEKHAHDVLWSNVLEAILFAWMLALGVSLSNIVLFFRFPIYEKIFGIVMRPLFMLSGVFYVPGQMPHPYREVLLLNPLSHVVILFREGFYGVNVTDGLDFTYLFWFSWALLCGGLLIFTLWPTARIRL